MSLRLLFWVIGVLGHRLLISVSYSWCPPPPSRQPEKKFNQKANKFWEFQVQSHTWAEISLPFNLVSCINESCKKVGSIESDNKEHSQFLQQQESISDDWDIRVNQENYEKSLSIRKRVSLTRMSEISVWVTGQSGSIYERFWNGVKWVIAPHELPTSAGYAVSVFIVNQTILALSEAGVLYQLQLNENSQPVWTEFMFSIDESISTAAKEPRRPPRVKSGVVSHDGETLYLSMTNGSLVEINQFQPLRWDSLGHPPGGDVSAVADTGTIRPGILFTVSSSGDLYEFDEKTKPSWRKHVWSEQLTKINSLIPAPGYALHGLSGTHSLSLFLLTKDGLLIERRLQKRKWKWIVHGAPKEFSLSAMLPAQQSETNEKILSFFFTTTTGCVFEYQLSKHLGVTDGKQEGVWINHMHPQNAKVARGVQGVAIQYGRLIFHLDDGRLGELHLPGFGGEGSGPVQLSSFRRKASNKYEWSVLDAPETEGWNAEYCSDERGPSNCLAGTKDVTEHYEPDDMTSISSTRRLKAEKHDNYIYLSNHANGRTENSNFLTRSIINNFRMRVMHAEKSFFLVTDSGLTLEYLYTDKIWIWLRHECSVPMKGAVGSYNGSLFFVDANGSLLIRERTENDLSWINCTAMKKGKQVATGPPWDMSLSKARRATTQDALFFVNKKGRLLQFTVARRKYKWKDCHTPPDTKIAYILDQEVFRANIIFVVGCNGHLYQYNRVTELWHEHYQSPHLVLSRSPGTAIRPSASSLTGTIFMTSENGALVEYHWDPEAGWEWVEHGTPYRDVLLVGAPGPCFEGTQLFVIGSDGNVYRRYLEKRTWKWTCHGYPYVEISALEAQSTRYHDQCAADGNEASHDKNAHHQDSYSKNCNEKVAPVRPIPFSEDSVIFELQDGRLAELQRSESDVDWEWARIIDTPTSLCLTSYWTAVST